jgi:hypothetical protein
MFQKTTLFILYVVRTQIQRFSYNVILTRKAIIWGRMDISASYANSKYCNMTPEGRNSEARAEVHC